MSQPAIFNHYDSVVGELRQRLDTVKALPEDPDVDMSTLTLDELDALSLPRLEAYYDFRRRTLDVVGVLEDLDSSLEMWVMEQPEGSLEALDQVLDYEEWERSEAFIERVQAWQRKIREALRSLYNLDSVDMDIPGGEQVLALLAALPRRP